MHCRNSCFGRSNRTKGMRAFKCTNEYCAFSTDNSACEEEAGIVCSKSNPKKKRLKL